MDYGKFKYDEKKRAGTSTRRSRSSCKSRRSSCGHKTDEHDYDFKVRNVRRFLEEGNKAKLT